MHRFSSLPVLRKPTSMEWAHFMDCHIVLWYQMRLFCPILTQKETCLFFVDLCSWSIKLTLRSVWDRDRNEDGYLHCNKFATLKSTANISVLQYPWLSALRLFYELLWWCGIPAHPSLWTGTQALTSSFSVYIEPGRGWQRRMPRAPMVYPDLPETQQNCFYLLNTFFPENCRANFPAPILPMVSSSFLCLG